MVITRDTNMCSYGFYFSTDTFSFTFLCFPIFSGHSFYAFLCGLFADLGPMLNVLDPILSSLVFFPLAFATWLTLSHLSLPFSLHLQRVSLYSLCKL